MSTQNRIKAHRTMSRSPQSLRVASLAALALSLAATSTHAQEVQAPAQPQAVKQEVNLPAIPTTPAAVTEVLAAIPFELTEPYLHNMRKDTQMVTRGHVLVLRAPKALLIPRQVAEPVLLVGAQTAERINRGADSGVLIVLVPEWFEGEADAKQVGDPLASRIYFATPELPERVDAAWIAREAAKADEAHIAVKPAIAREFVQLPKVTVANRDALGHFLADLVAKHAPTETDRIDDLNSVD